MCGACGVNMCVQVCMRVYYHKSVVAKETNLG